MTLPSPDQHTQFMQRALELASLGSGRVAPNPMVGCVVVNNGKIIGEGWHRQFGEAHAEVNAINSIAEPKLLEGATIYVTLEPCSHFGKTPPCAKLLSGLPVHHVVVAVLDPNPLVAGNGIKLLKEHGMQVTIGLLEVEATSLNSRFFTFHQRKRPYIILKWAQTQDGFIARENYDSKWISNMYSRNLVHKWRGEEAAIAVGANTVNYDNPRLTSRNWEGLNPTRVIINPSGNLPLDRHIFDGEAKTVIYTMDKEETHDNYQFIKLGENDFLNRMMQDLWGRDILSLFVEGGGQVLNALLEAGLWDEARVFIGKSKFGKGILAPIMKSMPQNKETLMEDVLLTYKN